MVILEIEDVIILGLLKKGHDYGYSLRCYLCDRGLTFSQAQIYKRLVRLEKRGLVSSQLVPDSGSRNQKRRYYTITLAGQNCFPKALAALKELVEQL